MHTLIPTLILTAALATIPTLVSAADNSSNLQLRPTGNRALQRVEQPSQPEKPAVKSAGYCCVGGRIYPAGTTQCRARGARFFPTQQAVAAGCRPAARVPLPPPAPKPPAPVSGPAPVKPIKPVKLVNPVPAPVSVDKPLPEKAAGVDLGISFWKWSENPRAGEPTGTRSILTISVTNEGSEAAAASRLTLRMVSGPDGVEAEPFAATHECPELAPGKSFTFAWPPVTGGNWKRGAHQFQLDIDDQNSVAETNEQNNRRIFTVNPQWHFTEAGQMPQVQQAGVPIGAFDLAIDPSPGWPQQVLLDSEGGPAVFRTLVTNQGTVPSPATEVRLSWFNPGTSGIIPMKGVALDPLAAGASATVEIRSPLPYNRRTQGVHHLYMTIDPMMELAEPNRDNNFTEKIAVDYKLPSDLTLFKPGTPPLMKDKKTQPGKPVNFNFVVYNTAADSDSGPITLTFTCEGQPPGVEHYTGIGGGNSSSGGGCTPEGHGCHAFTFTRTWTTLGAKNCEVTVRQQWGPGYEANPVDNHADFRVHVHPDFASPM